MIFWKYFHARFFIALEPIEIVSRCVVFLTKGLFFYWEVVS
jgi:hypothetical protein